jgi:hypothetical protein
MSGAHALKTKKEDKRLVMNHGFILGTCHHLSNY